MRKQNYHYQDKTSKKEKLSRKSDDLDEKNLKINCRDSLFKYIGIKVKIVIKARF